MRRINNGAIFCLLVLVQYIVVAESGWQKVEQGTQNCVVQVWSQIAKPDWAFPFRAPEHQQAAGSAFFISDRYLLTNFHVIDGAKSVYVNLPKHGRRPFDVIVDGVCPDLDVALLKLTDESYEFILNTLGQISFLPLGDSDKLYATEPVLALGYPLAERYVKSTVGVIAGREYVDHRSFMHITAPINPGNSGGPLLNKSGEVVGINSAGRPTAQNIGYIIPINDVKIVLNDLLGGKLCRKPRLGIRLQRATDEHVQSLGNPVPGGVCIYEVFKDSVCGRAGIQAGDVLYEIVSKGQTYNIDEYGDVNVNWRSSDKVTLGELLIRFELKEKLVFVVYRNGKRHEIDAIYETPEALPVRQIYPDFEVNQMDYEMFGGGVFMQLRENHFELIDTATMLRFKNPDKAAKEVLVIAGILPGSPMHKVHCFYPGVLLKSLNGQKVRNLTEFRQALKESAKTGLISIVTKDNVSTVLSLTKILREEPILAQNYMFPITQAVKELFAELMAIQKAKL